MSLSSSALAELLKAAGMDTENTQSDRREILRKCELLSEAAEDHILLLRDSDAITLFMESKAT